MVPKALTDAMKKLDDDTTALAGVVTDLRSQIRVGMSQEDVNAVQSTLAGIADRLEQTAKDPNQPVVSAPMPKAPARNRP